MDCACAQDDAPNHTASHTRAIRITSTSSCLLLRVVNFCDIAAWELHHSRVAVIGCIWSGEYRGSSRLGFWQRFGQIRDFVAGELTPIREREMTVSDVHGQEAELRLDSNPPVRVRRPPNLDAGRVGIVGDHLTVRKSDEATQEHGGSVGRNVDAILGNSLEPRIRRRCCMPVQLHVYTARPLNDRVLSDRIVERTDQDIGACRTRGSRRAVEVGHEISRAFDAEGVWDRSLYPNTDSVPTGV